jgi:protein Mpv17
MTIDQTFWAFGITCYYFTMINLLEHQSLQRGVDMIRNNIVDTMIMNWKIWPAAQILNFWLIPMPYRVLFVNVVGLVWQIFLVSVQHKE